MINISFTFKSHPFYHHALISCLLDAVHLSNHQFDPFLETYAFYGAIFANWGGGGGGRRGEEGAGSFLTQRLTELEVFLFKGAVVQRLFSISLLSSGLCL